MSGRTRIVLHNLLSLDLSAHPDDAAALPGERAAFQRKPSMSCPSGVVSCPSSAGDQLRVPSRRPSMSVPSARCHQLQRPQESRSGTWGYRGAHKSRHGVMDMKSTFSTLPRNTTPAETPALKNCSDPQTPDQEELSPYMSLTYAKLSKLKKQREELQRILNMLDDIENGFLGGKDNTSFIEKYIETRVNKDYMLSPGNPETTLEKGDKIQVSGYLGRNTWRTIGPYCKGYCRKGTIINPRIRSQNQIVELNIVCGSCNRITVPLIGAVPTSILQMHADPD